VRQALPDEGIIDFLYLVAWAAVLIAFLWVSQVDVL
jgi:hypothetical protein